MNAEYTGEIFITLLTIRHPDFPDILYVSSDPTTLISSFPLKYGTVSNGHTFLFCPMNVLFPDDVEGRPPSARLEISNVGRELIELARSVTTPGTCDINCVLASAPNTIEVNYPVLDIQAMQATAATLVLEFGLDPLDVEPIPAGIFGPANFPGLFQ